jgi:hypothetical protein
VVLKWLLLNNIFLLTSKLKSIGLKLPAVVVPTFCVVEDSAFCVVESLFDEKKRTIISKVILKFLKRLNFLK